jgi:uncharacterized protein YmfQ (DUF2313 family)
MASASAYLQLLQKLLPSGSAFNREDGTTLAGVLSAFADEFARVDGRVETLLREADPRTTTELLTDWERIVGLPDECAPQLGSVAERRNAVTLRYSNLGGQAKSYFINLAARLGFTITITEFKPFQAGSKAGDPLTNEAWRNTFRVNSPAETVRTFKAGSKAGEPLAEWGNDILECTINRVKPAHTVVQYAYGETETD